MPTWRSEPVPGKPFGNACRIENRPPGFGATASGAEFWPSRRSRLSRLWRFLTVANVANLHFAVGLVAGFIAVSLELFATLGGKYVGHD